MSDNQVELAEKKVNKLVEITHCLKRSKIWNRGAAAISANRLSAFTFETLRTLTEAGLMAWVIYLFFFQLSLVEGSSMEPNFQTGDRVFVNKMLYRWFSEPQRGDIVVHRFPLDPSQDFIKRVVALPGENWEIKGGKFFVEGKEIRENYIKEEMLMDHEMAVVPEKACLTMGDNRNNSSDGRAWGPVEYQLIKGRVEFRFWPPWKLSLTKRATYPHEKEIKDE